MTEETYIKITEMRRRYWLERCTLPVWRCRELLAAERLIGDLDLPSRVNPSGSRRQALDIFRAALAGKNSDEPVRVLSCKNIMRECRRPRGRVGDPWTGGA